MKISSRVFKINTMLILYLLALLASVTVMIVVLILRYCIFVTVTCNFLQTGIQVGGKIGLHISALIAGQSPVLGQRARVNQVHLPLLPKYVLDMNL